MNTLVVGPDRQQLYLWLVNTEITATQYIADMAKHRNDHQLIDGFVHRQGLQWTDLDRFVLLQVPHSNTTVRVDATLLGVSSWLCDRPLHIIDVDSTDALDLVALVDQLQDQDRFNEQALRATR